MTGRTCRDDILAALDRLEQRSGRREFTVAEIVQEALAFGSHYQPSTLRTHIVSRMCATAPDHHGTVYHDLLRVGRGHYRRR